MREVLIRIKDDLDTTLIADKTVPFAFDGQGYEIDLTAAHVDEFAADMERWITAGRKVKRQSRAKAVTANGADHVVPPRDKSAAAKAQRDRIRRWANKTGLEQQPRGVIRRDVADAYYAAHPKEKRP